MAELVTLARPYAKAAFEAACAEGKLQEWQQMLDVLAAVVSYPRMREVLAQPSLTAARQARILLDVCGDSLAGGVTNLVQVLAENKRVGLLPELAAQFREMKARHEKTVAVEIRSAFPLDAAVADRLAKALGNKWQCAVKLETEVDPSLLGGVVIKAGDTVIDASVRGRVLKLAEALTA